MTAKVLEVGPGVRPTKYAFDPSYDYLGVDPDMHYRVVSGYSGLIDRIKAARGDLTGFEYKQGQILGDLSTELAGSMDIVVMANVLGDPKTYNAEYSGLFVDPRSGVTRRTDIKNSAQLIAQALQCLRPGRKLTVVEDAFDQQTGSVHKTPDEIETILVEDESVRSLIAEHQLFMGADYKAIVADLYPGLGPVEPVPGYFDTCCVLECTAKEQ